MNGLRAFDWPIVAQLLVAAATLALAAMTWYMARQTRQVASRTESEANAVLKQAEAANRQVAVSTAALQASIAPWLVAALPRRERDPRQALVLSSVVTLEQGPDFIEVFVPFRNVGPGLAIVQSDRCFITGAHGSTEVRSGGTLTMSAVSPQAETQFVARISRTSAAWTGLTLKKFVGQDDSKLGEFTVELLYTDSRGGQPTWAKALIAANASDEWSIARIEYRRDTEVEPFADMRFHQWD